MKMSPLFWFLIDLSLVTCLRPMGDSILEIINTKEVERIIAEREQKAAQNDKRYLAENDLHEDDYELFDRQQTLYPNQEGTQERTDPSNPRISVDVLFRQNNHSDPLQNTALLHELRGFNGRKVLKSSKNALLVTKKEYLKKDWCKTEPLIQKIKEEGCLTRTVINRFCYGQCNSFYIPKNPRRRTKHFDNEDLENDLNGAAFKSCAFCKPKKFTWITVTLRCPSLMPQLRKKRIQRIKQCKCIAENLN